MQSSKTAQLRRSLHSQNESSTNRHQRDHGHGINTDLEHLFYRCLPAITIPNKGQGSAHSLERGPQLNIQAADIAKMIDGSFAHVFEHICHRDTFDPEERLEQPPASKRSSTPVTSKR